MAEPTLRTLLSTGPRRERARWAARAVSPWVLVWWLSKRANSRVRRELQAKRAQEPPSENERVETAVQFLVGQGLDEYEVREGSIPGKSLSYIADVVVDRLPRDRPVRALHVGNFVGVSLCYFSWLVRDRHPESVVISIDPNTTHRGIERPQTHVLALLHQFGLLGSNLIIQGYTLRGPDEWVGSEADYRRVLACENVLAGLERTCGESFDLVVIDGNHEESYLAGELAALRGLLADNSIVVFDDIADWEGVARVFGEAIHDDSFVELGQDGRVGILQFKPAVAASAAT